MPNWRSCRYCGTGAPPSYTASSTRWPNPAYNTVSTIVRILEKKGFVAHKAYGKTHEYYPVVSKDDYARRYMDTVLNNFFGGSVSRLVSFFSEHKAISLEETDAILDMLKNRK